MFNDMNGVMLASAKNKTQWKEDLDFSMMYAWQKLSKYYGKVTSTTGMVLIAANFLDPFGKLRLFRRWDMGIDNTPEDESSYTTHNWEAFLNCVRNECCAKRTHLPVIKPERILSHNLLPVTMGSKSCQSSNDPYNSCSDDGEYIMANNVAEMITGQYDRLAHLLTAARLNLVSPPQSTKT